MMNEQHIHDLRLVNWLAKDDRRRRKFCYAVKDALLSVYGVHAGYFMQEFTRDSWDEDGFSYGETYSWHKHILECVKIGDAAFHRPTNEFHYENVRGQVKHSPEFEALSKWCDAEKVIDGLKEAPQDFDRAEGVRALRRLVHAFYGELRVAIPKPVRTLYPFVKVRTWHGIFHGLKIRVPESITTCSGCGRKLTLFLGAIDVEEKYSSFLPRDAHPERNLQIRCDEALHLDWRSDCPEVRKERCDHKGWRDPNEPWKAEKLIVGHWAKLLIPEYLAWKNGTEPWAEKEDGGMLDLHNSGPQAAAVQDRPEQGSEKATPGIALPQ